MRGIIFLVMKISFDPFLKVEVYKSVIYMCVCVFIYIGIGHISDSLLKTKNTQHDQTTNYSAFLTSFVLPHTLPGSEVN